MWSCSVAIEKSTHEIEDFKVVFCCHHIQEYILQIIVQQKQDNYMRHAFDGFLYEKTFIIIDFV